MTAFITLAVGPLSSAFADGGISGTVTNATTHLGIAGITVDLFDGSYNFVDSTVTASDGTYTLPSQLSGSYEVEFEGSGYQTQFYDNKDSLGTATPVVVSSAAVSHIDAAMKSDGQISGTVTDASSSAPVQDIEVDVYTSKTAGATPVDSECTAADGTYTLSGLGTGTYYVGFNNGCGAGNYAPQFYNDASSLAAANGVSVTAGSTTSAINAAMTVGGQISGTVTDALSLSPVENVEVDVYASKSAGATPIDTECTAADGTYTASGLGTGTYFVGFNNGCGAGNYAPQFYAAKSSLAAANGVSVTAGGTTSSIDAAVTAGGQISGTVTDALSSSPVENIEVDVYASKSAGATPIDIECTASDGTYTASGLGTGSYYVGFNDGCGATNYASQFYSGKSSLAAADAVAVTAGAETTSIDAALQAGGEISGTVTDASSSDPVQDIEVDVYSSNGALSTPIDTVCTASDGTYDLSGLVTGTYYVGFNDGCGATGYAPQFYNDELSLATADGVSVTAGAMTSSIDAAMASGGRVSGTVTDATTSSGVAGVEVDLYESNDPGTFPSSVTCTAADGTYSFDDVLPGTYYVGFNEANTGVCDVSDYAPQFYNDESSLTAADEVSVTAGVTTSSIDAVMSVGGQISGTVTDALSSNPVQDVEVDVYASNAPGTAVLESACTSFDGTYSVSGLAAGNYYVEFNDGCGASGYAPQFYSGELSLATADAVSVTAGGTTSSIDAALTAGGQISGTVTDAESSDPAAGVEVDVYASKGAGATPVDAVCTAADGTYETSELAPGSYYVGFALRPSACGPSADVAQYYNGKTSLAAANAVAVTGGDTTSSIDAALTPGAHIAGTVRDSSSANPLGGVEVDVYTSNSSGAKPKRFTCTGNDGTYDVAALPAGTYYVGFKTAHGGLCTAGGYAAQFYNGAASLASADGVTVTAGSTASSIDAAMVAQVVTVAQLRAALLAAITPSRVQGTIRAVLKSKGCVRTFKALEPGRVLVSWSLVPRSSAGDARKAVLVAVGRRVFAATGSGKLKISLTGAGRKLLRQAKRSLVLTARGTFTPTAGSPVRAKKVFTLRH